MKKTISVESKKESYNNKEIEEIQQGFEDIKNGKVCSITAVAKKLGITLK